MNVKQLLDYGKGSIKYQHTQNKQKNLTLKYRLFVTAECVEKKLYTIGGNLTGAAIMEKKYTVSLKTKIKLPYDPGIPCLGIYPEKIIQKYMHPNAH